MKTHARRRFGRCWFRWLVVPALLGSFGSVLAVDGVIEINHAKALAGSVSPADAPAYPVTISASGSYRLTGNLQVPDLNTVALEITASDVTIDLNGFAIEGPLVCTGTPGSIECSPGSGLGIGGTVENVEVHDGFVLGFAAGGVLLGDRARVLRLEASANGGAGIAVGANSIVRHSRAVGNATHGIATGPSSTVLGNTVNANNDLGMQLGGGSGFASNVMNGNGGAPNLGGVPLGTNVCDGSPCACSGTTEVCDGYDNDCDGEVDEGSTWANLGQSCIVGVGSCETPGIFVCDAQDPPGSTICSAAAGAGETEVCDGFDNDCNGTVDDGPLWSNLGQPCTAGSGNCEAPGVFVCDDVDPSGPTVCSASAGAGEPEICDGFDNDCNGTVDDGPLWSNLGQPCTVGVGVCAAGGVFVCDDVDRSGPTVCSASAGAGEPEICDGFDNDCDGSPDNGLSPAACPEQNGVCAGSVMTCGGTAGWLPCNAGNYGTSYEVPEYSCDGLDNDCDGVPDNGLAASPCPQQAGVCAGSLQVCGGAAGWLACGPASYGPDYEALETICDGLDNDCDGDYDEGYRPGGVYGTDVACGNCFTDCTVIYDRPNASGSCDATTGAPVCEMICDDGYLDMNLVPGDGCEFGVDPDAIYVSSSDPGGDDDPGCGRDTGRPCLSIGVGLNEAVSAGRSRMLVADGAYLESVTLVPGIDLLGGHRPDTWERSVSGTNTHLYGDSGASPTKTIGAQNISTATKVEGFAVYGGYNPNPGGTSYAIWVADSTSALEIANNRIYGGQGGPATDGASGSGGADGGSGGAGEDFIETSVWQTPQCVSDPGTPGTGGTGGSSSCGSGGGSGAGAQCPNSNDRQDSGGPGVGTAGGSGGYGGYDRFTSNCFAFSTGGFSAEGLPGADGGNGGDGPAGSGCSNPVGSVAGNEWIADSGQVGGDATNGSGGGGGGAGGGADFQTSCGGAEDSLGGSGGGGGSGGCAGARGAPGDGGGGSFGIFISFTSPSGDLPTISGNTIQPGHGGRGGSGGNGGVGGNGGTGAPGGSVNGAASGPFMGQGGAGGTGGQGGHGGGGGGGCGGASFGMFVHNFSVTPNYDTTNSFLTGGAGGAAGSGGGSLGSSGTPGSDGASGSWNY